jgi:hypothetical protein
MTLLSYLNSSFNEIKKKSSERNKRHDTKILFVCNRTRNKHFACLEQAAKLNFAAVALTTAVKVKVISIFIYYLNYNISISVFAV